MKPRTRPLKDLYFRFIQPSGLSIEPQRLATLLWSLDLIELIPHRETGETAFYRDTEAMRGLSPDEAMSLVKGLL